MKIKNIKYFLTCLLCFSVIFGNTSLIVSADQEQSSSFSDNILSNDASVPSVDPFENDFRYSTELYNNTNGLPSSEVNDVAQTKDGFIWIGTHADLVRYDGKNFEEFSLEEKFSGVQSLYVDSQDRLWIGSDSCGIAVMDNGKITYWYDDDGLATGSVTALTEDGDGNIYAATKQGVAVINEDMKLSSVGDERIANKKIINLQAGADGVIYGLDADSCIFTVKNGKLEKYFYSNSYSATCMIPDPENAGYIYFASYNMVIRGSFDAFASKDESIYQQMELANLGILEEIDNIEYIDGMLWISTGTDVYTFKTSPLSPGKEYDVMCLRDIPVKNSIGHIKTDYQGNMWITSSRQGLMKIVPNRFEDVNAKYELPENLVNTVIAKDNKLYIATGKGLTFIDGNNAVTDITYNEVYYFDEFSNKNNENMSFLKGVCENNQVSCVLNDSKGRLWVSVPSAIMACLQGKTLHSFTEKYSEDMPGLESIDIQAMKELKDGTMLLGSDAELAVIKDFKLIKSYGREEGLENPSVLTIEEGENGDILIGSDGGGIYIINGDTVRNISTQDGLTSGVVKRIKKDRTRDIYWIITSNSVACMTQDGKITTVSEFPSRSNYDLFQNSRDDMWILSEKGVYIVPTEQMIANHDITFTLYTSENGMPCTPAANSNSCLDEKGDLYIAGTTGVVRVNIEKNFDIHDNYKIAVPYISADGKMIYPDKNGDFHISSDVRKLVVYSYVLNSSLISPTVSYRLEGFEDKGTTVSYSGLAPIDYTNLSGGDYWFSLNVTDSVSNKWHDLTVTIQKDKAFYEQIWFYILIGLLDLLILAVAAQLIWLLRMKKIRQKYREEVEKERINAELQTASKIQTGSMPDVFPPFPDRTEFDIFASMDPAKEVGGDFYDFFLIDEDHLCMVMADVSGKGVPAALFMMSAKIIISDYAEMGRSPAEILTAANAKMSAGNPEKMFVTVWIGILEISTGRLTAANAGHEYPILMQPNGKFEMLRDKHGPMICFIKKFSYREYEMELKPGAKLFLYTDGVPESTDSEQQMFGMDRLLEALNRRTDASAAQILKNVRGAVDRFVGGAEQFDDLTMMCLEYKKTL